jgi:hypothetical protein
MRLPVHSSLNAKITKRTSLSALQLFLRSFRNAKIKKRAPARTSQFKSRFCGTRLLPAAETKNGPKAHSIVRRFDPETGDPHPAKRAPGKPGAQKSW